MNKISTLISLSALACWPMMGQIQYPITQEMHNPLFVNLPSPVYEADSDEPAWPYKFNPADTTGHKMAPLYTADASAHVWNDGRLYLYASHDLQEPRGCDRMDRYHVFSTDDMVHWTDHGEILNSADVMEQAGWGIPGWMWAPDCAYNPADGLYYYYFPHVNKVVGRGHDWRIGVATSDRPDGGFKMKGYVEGAANYIDPCVFVDDDGQAYFYNGGGGTCMGGKLMADDWTKLDGEMVKMEGLDDFHEATWINKFNGKYYLSHSDNHYGNDGNYMRYAVSDNPLGPWKAMGIYMYPTGTETNHGSIVEYKGKLYAFYHTSNFSGQGTLRSVCFDEIGVNPDGTLAVVRNWGEPKGGVMPRLAGKALVIDGSAYNDGGEHYAYHKNSDAPVMPLAKKEWARYSFTVDEPGTYDIVVNTTGEGTYHLSICGHDVSGRRKAGTAEKIEYLPIYATGEQYFDIRVEDGNVTLDNITVVPVAFSVTPGQKKYDSYEGLVMAGYQGWFCAPDDGAGRGWYHYTGSRGFRPGSCTIDFWPEVSEYEKLYPTAFKFDDGTTAYLPSSHDSSTVETHFRWMEEYGLDGVFMQRFVGEISNNSGKRHFNKVLNSAMTAANKHNRAVCVMYDLSGMPTNGVSTILSDIDEIAEVYKLFDHDANPSYLYHNGKPLVAVWGLGFNDKRRYGLAEGNDIIDGLKAKGYSVMIGVPTQWEQLTGDTESDPGLHDLIRKCDVVMPWFVGRYDQKTYPKYKKLIKNNLMWAKANGVDYAPLCFPGFSWENMHAPRGSRQIARNSGSFFWDQLSNVIDLGAKMIYIAMFDEIDEGTAIFKCAHKVPTPQPGSTFVPIDDDVDGDYYLFLAGEAGKALRGEKKLSKSRPVR